MDMTVLANFLLFLGVFGVSFSTHSGSSSSSAPTDSLYDSSKYDQTINGTGGADDLSAGSDNLAWFMGAGEDTLSGSAGNDFADLGSGNDHADMGAGNDIVEGGTGDDSITGGNGNDLILGQAGNDALAGDLGDDSLGGGIGDDLLAGGTGADILSGGDGNDILSGFHGDAGATAGMVAGDGNDQLFGGNGDDALLLGHGDSGTGGSGADSFTLDTRWHDGSGLFHITDYNQSDDQINILYAANFDPNTSLPTLPHITVENSADGASALIRMNGTLIAQIDGAAGLTADQITLSADNATDTGFLPGSYSDVFHGTDGADTVTGTAENDYARVGTGDDHADMGAGDDSVRGEGGDDHLDGGAGNDTIDAGDGADSVDAGAGNDIVVGGLGNDVVLGGAGADRVLGGGGDDTLSGYSATGAGDAGLSGSDGADSLSGGAGEDHLIIGAGDLAYGGADADTFHLDMRWDGTAQVAVIADYVPGSDVIELEYTPAFDGAGVEIPPVVDVLQGPNGAYAVITLNSEPVAHVTGATTLTLADIALIRAS